MNNSNNGNGLSHSTNQSHFFTRLMRVRLGGAQMKQQFTYATTIVAAVALLFVGVNSAWARPMYATAPTLGTSASFGVLSGQSVSNTGPTTVIGNLGVSPGTAVVGFPPGVVTGGTIHAGDAVALQAQSDLTQAYNAVAGQPCNINLTGQDLGGMTLTPGVYCFNTSAQLTGMLTLDGQGDPAAVFVFQMGSTLITASNASILLLNGAADCNVYWQVGSSATLGTNTVFAGNILALTSITLNTGADLYGRALARNGSVTLDDNTITSSCVFAAPTNTPGPSDGTATPTSTPIGGNPSTPVATNTLVPPVNPLTPVATNTLVPPVNPLTPVATNTPLPPRNPLTPVAPTQMPPLNTLTPVATPTEMPPVGAGTPGAPSALDPVGQPSDSTVTMYLPFGVK